MEGVLTCSEAASVRDGVRDARTMRDCRAMSLLSDGKRGDLGDDLPMMGLSV